MINRVWTARAPRHRVSDYVAHFCDTVLPALRRAEGFRGARVLERPSGDQIDLVVVTEWESLDHIRAFGGADVERAVVSDEAKAMLTRFDGGVRHYHVVLDLR